ncbi:hypothetical protein WN55_05835 [Dufourea novaeangliae]|uniref:Uncharacterized protein n=1 Tax=Dufourea novaeangliae TaxID=178035 RepID=A0A154P075_DUFNO|nr:hypothetical protein WN55_05835 [Dufourea novaeangliae]
MPQPTPKFNPVCPIQLFTASQLHLLTNSRQGSPDLEPFHAPENQADKYRNPTEKGPSFPPSWSERRDGENLAVESAFKSRKNDLSWTAERGNSSLRVQTMCTTPNDRGADNGRQLRGMCAGCVSSSTTRGHPGRDNVLRPMAGPPATPSPNNLD